MKPTDVPPRHSLISALLTRSSPEAERMVRFHPARPEVLRCSPDLHSEIEEIEEKLKAFLVTQRNGKQAINFCRTDADR